METPSLKQVKKHFENAKRIRLCNSDVEIKVNVELIEKSEIGGFNEKEDGRYLMTNGSYHCVWCKTAGYAKILSYKEKTYSITESQIKDLHDLQCTEDKNDVLEELFPDVFKTELVVGKWYKSLRYPKQIIFVSEFKDVQHIKGYGFDTRGKWESCDGKLSWGLPSDGNYREATEQEVTEALTKEVFKRYTGKYVKPLNEDIMDRYDKKGIILKFENIHLDSANRLWCTAGEWQCIIFDNGKWVEVIDIKEMNQSQIEKELGYKIKIID